MATHIALVSVALLSIVYTCYDIVYDDSTDKIVEGLMKKIYFLVTSS